MKRNINSSSSSNAGAQAAPAERYIPVYEGAKYTCTREALEQMLDQWGVAVVPGVLNGAECVAAEDGMWRWLAKATANFAKGPILKDNPNSYKNFYELWPKHAMLLQNWEAGHAQHVWDVRQNPSVVDVFARLWKTRPEDLLVSFDGVSYGLPPESMGKGYYNNERSWLHADQSMLRNGRLCIQGLVNVREARDGDATFMCYPGSHNHHGDFARTFAPTDGTRWSNDDWVLMDKKEHHDFYKGKGCILTAIKAPAGSMILWDSRTIHCGKEADEGRAEPNTRCAIYACMKPRSGISASDLKKKQEYFITRRLTNHWPDKIKVFGKLPHTYGKALENITPPTDYINLTDLGNKIAGF